MILKSFSRFFLGKINVIKLLSCFLSLGPAQLHPERDLGMRVLQHEWTEKVFWTSPPPEIHIPGNWFIVRTHRYASLTAPAHISHILHSRLCMPPVTQGRWQRQYCQPQLLSQKSCPTENSLKIDRPYELSSPAGFWTPYASHMTAETTTLTIAEVWPQWHLRTAKHINDCVWRPAISLCAPPKKLEQHYLQSWLFLARLPWNKAWLILMDWFRNNLSF